MFSLYPERSWHWCALVLALVSFLILPGLGSYGLWDPYELDVLQRALDHKSDANAPLLQWSVEHAIAHGGMSEWSARLPIALCGIACTLLCFVWVARASSIRTATLASLLFASSPLFLLHSRQIVNGMPSVAGHLLVVIGASEALYCKRWRASGAGIVTASAGLAIGYAGSGAVLGVAVPLAALSAGSTALRRWAPSLVFASATILTLVLTVFGLLNTPGTWREMSSNASWEVMLEQIVFGAFPWVLLAPATLLTPGKVNDRNGFARQFAVAWVAISLVVASAHSFHVGPTMFLAVPALAFAAAEWACQTSRSRSLIPHQILLLCLLLLMLALDLRSFSERFSALHLPVESLRDGTASGSHRALFVAAALGVSAILITSLKARLRHRLPGLLCAACLVFSATLSHSWIPWLSKKTSHSHLVRRYLELRVDDQPILSLGKVPKVLKLYAPSAMATQRKGLIEAFLGESRVFALVPKSSYCALRQAARQRGLLPVVLDENLSFVLMSNQHRDGEPRREALDASLQKLTPGRSASTHLNTVWNDTLRLHSIEMPKRVSRGQEFDVEIRYEVLKRPRRKWKIFAHFDGPGHRFQGDHWPIGDRCASNLWNRGDLVVDKASVKAGGITTAPGHYRLWTGFFYGSHGNWTRMPVSGGEHDDDRVLVGEIELY